MDKQSGEPVMRVRDPELLERICRSLEWKIVPAMLSEAAKRRVAELEEMVSRLREVLEQRADDATPSDKILDRGKRTLSVRMASLKRARMHQRFIETKIQTGANESFCLAALHETCACLLRRGTVDAEW
jgi:hypothetical protein